MTCLYIFFIHKSRERESFLLLYALELIQLDTIDDTIDRLIDIRLDSIDDDHFIIKRDITLEVYPDHLFAYLFELAIGGCLSDFVPFDTSKEIIISVNKIISREDDHWYIELQ